MTTRYQAIAYQPSSHPYFERLRQLPLPVLLESTGNSALERFDIITANPIKCIDPNQYSIAELNHALSQALADFTTQPSQQHANTRQQPELPFIAGAIGLLGYHAGEQIVGLTPTASNTANFHIGIYQWALIQDHLSQQAWLVADAKLDSNQWRAVCQLIEEPLFNKNQTVTPFYLQGSWATSLPKNNYSKAFNKAKDYIHAGDCYQINLTRRFSNQYKGDNWQAYQALKTASPAPFSAFFETPNSTIVSCSPERFIQINQGHVLTQPIKGTRPRGSTPAEDTRLIAELLASSKDRAENLMIVDLMRNDLGKHCITGSVTVPQLFQIESFSNVHHMVSSVRGEIKAYDVQASIDTLLSCIPGGSVTGAPKKRAMQIIRELEPCPRSIYCGSIFYLNRNGDLDSNILIRSLLFEKTSSHEGAVHCWGGGGIVADSVMENEFKESYYKVSNLLSALEKLNR